MKSSTSRRTRFFAFLGIAALVGSVVGCHDIVQSELQRGLDTLWSNSLSRSLMTTRGTAALSTALQRNVVGQSVGPVPILGVDNIGLAIGGVAPRATVMPEPVSTLAGNTITTNFNWRMDWQAGNGAAAAFRLLMPWYCPDLSIRIDNIVATATGNATVTDNLSTGVRCVSATVFGATATARAQVTLETFFGDFGPFDISGLVQPQVSSAISAVAGQAFNGCLPPGF